MYNPHLVIFTTFFSFVLITASPVSRDIQNKTTSCLLPCVNGSNNVPHEECCKKSLLHTLKYIHEGDWGPLTKIPVREIYQTYTGPFKHIVSVNTTLYGLFDTVITNVSCDTYEYRWDFTIPELIVEGIYNGSVESPYTLTCYNIAGNASFLMDTLDYAHIAYVNVILSISALNIMAENPDAQELAQQFISSPDVETNTAEAIAHIISDIIYEKFNLVFPEDKCSLW